MVIDKQDILELLRSRGDDDTADQTQNELPDPMDADQHSAKPNLPGSNPSELLGGIGGTFG